MSRRPGAPCRYAQRMDPRITVRVTPDQEAAYRRAAACAGLSLAEWIRQELSRAAAARPAAVQETMAELAADVDWTVRYAVARNPSTPPPDLRRTQSKDGGSRKS